MNRQTCSWFSALALGAAYFLFSAATARALDDDFDSEIGSGAGASGGSGLNYDAFANWTVSSGTVDLIASGDFGIDCVGKAGKCVDLDGATGEAGRLLSQPVTLAPGQHFLSFALAGVSDVFSSAAAGEPNVVDVSVGSLFSMQVTREQGDPFETFGGSFLVPESTTAQIAFANQGGDKFGALLDNVRLIPEPGALGLSLVAGLILLASWGCRRCAPLDLGK